MRKRSEQIHSRESSATLQLTVSLLYRQAIETIAQKYEQAEAMNSNTASTRTY